MKYNIFIILLLFSLLSLSEQIEYSIDKKYKSEELQEDLDVFIQAYNDIYPSLYRYRTKHSVDRFLLEIRANLKYGLTEMDFFKQISLFCSFVGDVHSEIIPSKRYLKYEKDAIKKFPFKIVIVDKKLYILENYSDNNSINPGNEIISINHKPAVDIIMEIIPYIGSDGYNLTYKYHYLSKYFGKYYTRIIGSPDMYDIEIVKHGENNQKTITVHAKSDKEIKEIKKQKYPFDKVASLDFKEIDNLISYLRISSFNNSSKNSNGMKYESFIDSVFTLLQDNVTSNLIIDLRWNGGGDDKNGALLYSYLTDKPFRYYDCLCVAITAEDTLRSQKYFEVPEDIDVFKEKLTVDSKGRKIIILDNHPGNTLQQPKTNNYQGRVYLLINGKGASATSEFCSIAKHNERGKFVGEETGGGFYGNTSGWSNTLILPNTKCQVEMSFVEYRTAVVNSNALHGRGIIPDHIITRNIQDILKDHDRELEYTIDLIKKKKI